MWATSKFLMDGSTITEERARGCHESRVTRRGSRDGQSRPVFPRGTEPAECHPVPPEGSPWAHCSWLPFLSPLLHSPTIFITSFYEPCSVLKPRKTKVKNKQTKAWLFLQLTIDRQCCCVLCFGPHGHHITKSFPSPWRDTGPLPSTVDTECAAQATLRTEAAISPTLGNVVGGGSQLSPCPGTAFDGGEQPPLPRVSLHPKLVHVGTQRPRPLASRRAGSAGPAQRQSSVRHQWGHCLLFSAVHVPHCPGPPPWACSQGALRPELLHANLFPGKPPLRHPVSEVKTRGTEAKTARLP